jgi:hypothetical protein
MKECRHNTRLLTRNRIAGRLRGTAIALSIIAGAACSSVRVTDASASDKGDQLTQREFRLLTFDGKLMPAEFAPLPQRAPGSDTALVANCWLMIVPGDLSLNDTKGQFALHYSVGNSCTGVHAYDVGLDGSFTVVGGSLGFVVPAADPPDYRFSGTVDGNKVVVQFVDEQLVFGR